MAARGLEPSTEPSSSGRVFYVHWKKIELKLTVKSKALGKSFLKTILEPAVKAINARLPPAEHVALGDFEQVLLGPGGFVEPVTDLSVPVASLIPSDLDDDISLQVTFIRSVERKVHLSCNGLQREAEVPAECVQLSLREGVLSTFIRELNSSAHTTATLDDISSVTVHPQLSEDPYVVDSSLPSWQILPRIGRTHVEVTLKPAAAAALQSHLASTQPSRPTEKAADAGATVAARGGRRRSIEEWQRLQIDSDDETEASEDVLEVDGRRLLRDAADVTCDWLEEAEALFRLSSEQAINFALEYPRVKIEDGVSGRVGGGKGGEGARRRIALAAAGIDELPFEVFPVQEHMPAAAYADRFEKKATRCILWMPTPREARASSSETLLPGSVPPAEGLPLVVIAHGGRGHARGPHNLWLAWYLVRQFNCAVLAVDHLPHHGVRTPAGSASCDKWPAADLGDGDGLRPWSADEWERTLRRSTSELGFALDVALALPSSKEIDRSNKACRRSRAEALKGLSEEERAKKSALPATEQNARHWLNKLADRSRMRLAAAADGSEEPRMIDPDRVGFVGYGFGALAALPFLASDAAGSARVRSAVLGFTSDLFSGSIIMRERTAGGLSVRAVSVPGTSPPPPAGPFAARVRQWAAAVCVPVHFVASEADESISQDRARALFDSFGCPAEARRFCVLPGARGLTVGELGDQMSWLHEQMATAPKRPRPSAGAPPCVPIQPSARASERCRERERGAAHVVATSGGGSSPMDSSVSARPKHTTATRSLEARMQAAREDMRAEQATEAIERPVALGAEAAPRRKKSAEVVDVTDENAEEEVDDLEVPGMDAMMAMVDAQRIARERNV